MSKTATFMGTAPGEWLGQAKWYRLDPPLEHEGFNWESDAPVTESYADVIVSAVVAMFTGPETLIFPADEHGEIQNWLDLDGSQRGTLSHESVLTNLGYEVK